jgi:septum formation protein
LAAAKAKYVSTLHPGAYVIGADQILDLDGVWFDKPTGRNGAGDHLNRLRGRTHTLVDGLAVIRDGEILWRRHDTARLTMRNFSDEFLADYLDRSGPDILESVGAYRLEGRGTQLFSAIDGDYFTILGLPLLPLLDYLREVGLIAE